MKRYICIDGGTTNTRINLLEDRKLVFTSKFNIGIRKAMEDKDLYCDMIKDGIKALLEANDLCEKDVCRILASGMITSEYGLAILPHCATPVGITELHSNVFETALYDISSIPFVFIRGVKTSGTQIENVDMMRGEEAELIGILRGEGVYVLPGSHSKIIEVDSKEKIVDVKTMLTGEMYLALAQNTILKGVISIDDHKIDDKWLLNGHQYATKYGLNEALFKVRVLKTVCDATDVEARSFYMGAVLSGEINAILKNTPSKIIVGGSEFFRKPMSIILNKLSDAEIVVLDEKEVQSSSSLGMIRIFEGS